MRGLPSRDDHDRPGALRPRRRVLTHPAQAIVAAFTAAIALGTLLLLTPAAAQDGDSVGLMPALFTATSAVTVTGLSTVDVPGTWSYFGEIVILVLIQAGGLGVMTLATLLALALSQRIGLASRLTAAAETKAVGIGDVRALLGRILRVALLVEAAVAVVLTLRFALAYDETPLRAAYLGVFHAVSSFNNAGFALWSDNLIRFVGDPWVCLPISLAVILGGIGYPVLLELRRTLRPRLWSLHARLTVWTYLALLVAGVAFVTANEWGNPGTLGALGTGDRLLAGFFHGVMPRTAGFNSLDVGAMAPGTLFGTDILMFIGGGSAGTAGGIKVTTFILLFFVILAEVRGQRDVNVAGRRIDERVTRQALTVALLAVGAVAAATLLVLHLTTHTLSEVLFEVTSAFATVGLSTGITADLPASAQLVLVVLMLIGRVGPVTLVSSLALRERPLRYSLPEGRPLIG